METRRLRWRVAGWGLSLVGGAGAVYSVVRWGTATPFLIALFGVLAVGGGLVLAGREGAYYYLLPVVALLALLQALGYYLNYGVTVLTLAFALLGAVSLVKTVRAYCVR